MIQTKLTTFCLWLSAMTVAGICTSCSDLSDNGGDSSLPPGKYPISFTASVDGLSVSRSTGKDAWQNNDPIAVSVNGGSSSQTYKITDTATGAMEPETSSCYWQQNTGQRILAWYPPTDVIDADISNQSGGFAVFDYLTADKTADFTTGSVDLSFRHQMAKVKCTLTFDNGLFTQEEQAGAVVTFFGYTKASFTHGGLTGTEEGWIIPHTDKEALLVPRQMKDLRFIKVIVGKGAAVRNYYYTPTGGDDANLEAGKQYTYALTVKREDMSVTVNTSSSWDEETINGGSTSGVTDYHVYLDDFVATDQITGCSVTTAGGTPVTKSGAAYPLSVNESLHVTLTVAENYILKDFRFSSPSGVYRQRVGHDAAQRTYTYILSDLRSDVYLGGIEAEAVLSSGVAAPNTGDYYYSDGSWSSMLTSDKVCIGIVFKAASGADDDASRYDCFLAGGDIHGYVVALEDAHAQEGAWGIRLVAVDGLEDVTSTSDDKYNGYYNTGVVKMQDEYTSTNISAPTATGQYWAFKVATGYSVSSPASSSGWYLPSIAQLDDLYDVLNTYSSRLSAAGGAALRSGRYWSATQKNLYDAWYLDNGNRDSYGKDSTGGPYLHASRVRAILTF